MGQQAYIVRKRRLIYARTYCFPVIQNNLYSLEMHELTFLFLPLFHVFCTVWKNWDVEMNLIMSIWWGEGNFAHLLTKTVTLDNITSNLTPILFLLSDNNCHHHASTPFDLHGSLETRADLKSNTKMLRGRKFNLRPHAVRWQRRLLSHSQVS